MARTMAPHASAEVRRLHRGRGEATSTQVVGPWGRRCKWTVSYQGPEKPQPQLPCPGRSPCMPHPAGQPQGEEQDAVFTTETIRLKPRDMPEDGKASSPQVAQRRGSKDRRPGHLLERPLRCSSPAALHEAPVTASRIRP